MTTETSKDILAEKKCIDLPEEIVEDLNRIASVNGTEVEKLIYGYIVEGIAGDSLLARRMEFTDRTNEVLSKFNVPPKSVEDIAEMLL